MRQNPAVLRSFAILRLIAELGDLSVPEIARELGLPKSSAHELVATLRALGCLQSAQAGVGRVALGVALHELGSAYLEQIDFIDLVKSYAEDIAAASRETVQVAVLDGLDAVYLVKVDSVRKVRMASSVGARIPAPFTAVGKALMSGLTEAELRSRLHHVLPLTPMTPNSIVDEEAIVREVRGVKQSGLAFDHCESNLDVCCVAAPLHDHTGTVVAATSVSTPVHRVGPGWPDDDARLLTKSLAELSRTLGWRKHASPEAGRWRGQLLPSRTSATAEYEVKRSVTRS